MNAAIAFLCLLFVVCISIDYNYAATKVFYEFHIRERPKEQNGTSSNCTSSTTKEQPEVSITGSRISSYILPSQDNHNSSYLDTQRSTENNSNCTKNEPEVSITGSRISSFVLPSQHSDISSSKKEPEVSITGSRILSYIFPSQNRDYTSESDTQSTENRSNCTSSSSNKEDPEVSRTGSRISSFILPSPDKDNSSDNDNNTDIVYIERADFTNDGNGYQVKYNISVAPLELGKNLGATTLKVIVG